MGQCSYRRAGQILESQQKKSNIFSTSKSLGRSWGPPSLLFNRQQGFFLEIKRQRRTVEHSHPPGTGVKNEWSYTSAFTIRYMRKETSLLLYIWQTEWLYFKTPKLPSTFCQSIQPRPVILCYVNFVWGINLLNAELNPICHFLALLGAHHILHVSRIRVKTASLHEVHSFHSTVCLRTGSQPLLNPVTHRVRSSTSSFNFQ